MTELLNPVFENLQSEADSRQIEIHPSFYVELKNYSRHVHVDQLTEHQLSHVIHEIGKSALASASGRVGGGAVRHVIIQRCPDPFSDCFEVARLILER